MHDTIPPTINHFTDDPAIDPRFKLTFNTPEKRNRAGCPEQYLRLRRA